MAFRVTMFERMVGPKPLAGFGTDGATTGTRTQDLSLTKDALYH